MVTSSTQSFAKRKKPVTFGRKFAKIYAGKKKTSFSVHEDLLCSRSKYFRQRLQSNRKKIEEKCTICNHDFEPEKDDISHCTACGQNIHTDCIDQWLDQRTSQKRCPFCRAKWESEDKVPTSKCPALDGDGFATYVKWIYGQGLPLYKSEEQDMDERTIRLMKSWFVGNIVCDVEFKNSVIKQIAEDVESNDYLPKAKAMRYLFSNSTMYFDRAWSLENFCLDIFVLKGKSREPAWWESLDEPWVIRFVTRLAKRLMRSREDGQGSLESLVQDHTEEEVVEVDNEPANQDGSLTEETTSPEFRPSPDFRLFGNVFGDFFSSDDDS